jgi:hypothetical protein
MKYFSQQTQGQLYQKGYKPLYFKAKASQKVSDFFTVTLFPLPNGLNFNFPLPSNQL